MIWGVSGLWALYGKNNVSKVLDKLAGLGVKTAEFKHIVFAIIHTYMIRKIFNTEHRLYKQLSGGDSIIAHSFGGLLVIDMINSMSKLQSSKKFKNIYLFNPSIDGDVHIESSHFEKMYIFYEPRDRLLKLAKWLPVNKLGDLGKYGYRYADDNIINIKINKIDNENTMMHDNAMIEPNLTTYAEFIQDHEKLNDK